MLQTYILAAWEFLIASRSPFTRMLGITLVYRLPGPRTIMSALETSSKASGRGSTLLGFNSTLLMGGFPGCRTLNSPSTMVPSASSAHIWVSSSVEGRSEEHTSELQSQSNL